MVVNELFDSDLKNVKIVPRSSRDSLKSMFRDDGTEMSAGEKKFQIQFLDYEDAKFNVYFTGMTFNGKYYLDVVFSYVDSMGREIYVLVPQPPKIMFRVFTVVKNELMKILEKYPFDYVSFDAKTTEESRVSFYRSLADKLAIEFDGKVDEKTSQGGYVEFEVDLNRSMREFDIHRNINQSLVEEFLRSYLGEDIGGIGGVGQSTNFQAFAPEHMLGRPVTLNRNAIHDENNSYEMKPFPGNKK